MNEVQDVTQAIKDSGAAILAPAQRTLNAQVQCKITHSDNAIICVHRLTSSGISWSGQTDMGEGKRWVDGSLLALGNRAGRVIFMRFTQSVAAHVSFKNLSTDSLKGGC